MATCAGVFPGLGLVEVEGVDALRAEGVYQGGFEIAREVSDPRGPGGDGFPVRDIFGNLGGVFPESEKLRKGHFEQYLTGSFIMRHMDKIILPSPVQYITEKDGKRVGVVLAWEDYQKISMPVEDDSDLLPGMDEAELRALAEGMLSPKKQSTLDTLLQKNREGKLSDSELRELNELLAHIDFLNILKSRAIYTLQQLHSSK